MNIGTNGTVVAVVIVVIAFVAIASFLASRLRTVPSNEVLIVVGKGLGARAAGPEISAGTSIDVESARTGRDTSQDRIYFAGRVFVWPVLQKAFPMSLKQRQVELTVTGQDSNFINVSVIASLNFKMADSVADVRKSAQRFLTHTDAELKESIQNSLEGSLRSIIGSMAVQEMNSDRAKLQEMILTTAKAELAEQGIHVDILNIRDIKTPGEVNYLAELAKPEAARVEQMAKVAASEAKQASEQARLAQEENTANREKELALQVAANKAETDRAEAVANAAGEIAKAQQDVEVAKLEREALTQQALVEAERLDISEKKPADAAAYAARVKAEGERDAAKAKAEGDAFEKTTLAKADQEAAVFEATGKAESVKLEAKASAEAITLKGNAEAEALEAVGTAQAKASEATAAALNTYTANALVYELATRMPEIVRAAAEPMASIDNYTVISTDGASDTTKQVGKIVTEIPELLKSTLGIDLTALLSGFVGGKAAGHEIEASAPASKDSNDSQAPSEGVLVS